MNWPCSIGTTTFLAVAGALLAATAAAQNPVALAPQSLELPPLDTLRATRERPLFAPSRRPPKAQVELSAPTPVTEDETLPFQLTGIVLGQDFRVAILRQNAAPEELRLKATETIAGWTIEEIGDRYVILGGKGKRVRVWLFDESKKAGITVQETNAPAPSAVPEKRDDIDRDVMPNAAPQSQSPPPAPPARPRPRNPPPPAPVRPQPRPIPR